MSDDVLVRALIGGGAARVIWVDVSDTAAEVVRRHGLDGRAAVLASELVVANTLMAAWIKGEERVQLQLQAAEPEAAFFGEVDAEGAVRARFTPAGLPGAGRDVRGVLLAIKSDAHREMYRGLTEIRGESVAHALGRHLATSDQVAARVRIDVGGEVARGAVLERLPPARDKASLDDEDFDALGRAFLERSTADLATDVLGYTEPDAATPQGARTPLRFSCRCDRDRVVGMLRGLGRDEVQAMLLEDGGAEVTCHFCNEVYRFDADALGEVLATLSEET